MMKSLLAGAAALMLSTAVVPPVAAQSVAGAYLAGRHAAVNSDYREAARYYTEALTRDSGNVELMESAVLARLALGDVALAAPIARVLENRYLSGKAVRSHKTEHSLMGEKCPECGQTVSFEEGCMTCHFCGFTKCG